MHGLLSIPVSSVEEREIQCSWEEMGSSWSEEAHLPKRASWRKTERTSAISSHSCPCWDILTLKSQRKKRGSKSPGSVRWHQWIDSINVQGSISPASLWAWAVTLFWEVSPNSLFSQTLNSGTNWFISDTHFCSNSASQECLLLN